jgi:UDP-N-acetylmuramyl pentapeptide phosphotransferase/UDP-N-acetylglucosamine-1-phosphate transferase
MLTAAAAGAITLGTRRALAAVPPGGAELWTRRNHRGETVTLLAGPALATGIAAGTLLPAGAPARARWNTTLAVSATAAIGGYDDLRGATATKGLRGHLSALSRREVTSGAVKAGAIGLTGVVAARGIAPTRGLAANLLDGALIAGGANLLNLFDLRPGRALKVALLAGPAVVLPGGAPLAPVMGAALATLPDDLAERSMLGDCGANSLGAALGCALVVGAGPWARVAALAGVTGLTLASERFSFTAVIERIRALAWFDGLGRRPAAD